jgi:hypothetical protein
MASCLELKKLTKKRRHSAKLLLDGGDWEMAIYMMAMALELALKSASCYALKLEAYPESNDSNDSYFKSHNFDRLLRVSGMMDIFSVRIPMKNQDAFDNLSIFTRVFLFPDRDYVAMRYDPRMLANFNEAKARELYAALYDDKNSILKTMTRYRKW